MPSTRTRCSSTEGLHGTVIFPSPQPPHSAPDWQTSVRDPDVSVGVKGGSFLPFTKHLTRARAAQLLSFNPLGPCKAAS